MIAVPVVFTQKCCSMITRIFSSKNYFLLPDNDKCQVCYCVIWVCNITHCIILCVSCPQKDSVWRNREARSLATLQVWNSSWRPFRPLDFFLCALWALRTCDPCCADNQYITHQWWHTHTQWCKKMPYLRYEQTLHLIPVWHTGARTGCRLLWNAAWQRWQHKLWTINILFAQAHL